MILTVPTLIACVSLKINKGLCSQSQILKQNNKDSICIFNADYILPDTFYRVEEKIIYKNYCLVKLSDVLLLNDAWFFTH